METLTAPPLAPSPAAKPAQSAPLTSVPPSLAFPPPSTATSPKAETSDNPWDSVDNDVKPRSVEDAPKPAPKTPEPPKAPESKPAPKPPEKPAVAQPARPGEEGVKQLRAERERLQGEVTAASTRATDLQAKLDAAMARGGDTEALSKRLADAEKERDDAKKELSFSRYEPSESVKSIQQRWTNSVNSAKTLIEKLNVTNPDGTTSKAKWSDFRKYLLQDDDDGVIEAIREKFGTNGELAVTKYLSLYELQQERESAEKNDRAGFNDRVLRETATKTQHKEGFGKMVNQVRQDMAAKNTEFAHSPDDPEADAIFKKGKEVAQLATGPQFNSLSPQQQAVLVANMELRAAAFPRLQFKYNRMSAELEKLKAENAELRGGTAPPEARPGGIEHQAGEKSFMDDLNEDSKGWETR